MIGQVNVNVQRIQTWSSYIYFSLLGKLYNFVQARERRTGQTAELPLPPGLAMSLWHSLVAIRPIWDKHTYTDTAV